MKLETQNGHFVFTVAPKERSLGYLGENNTQTICIMLDQEYPGWIFRMEFGTRENFVYLTQEAKTLTIELERGWLPESGSIPVQICGTLGDTERRSNIVRFQLARSVGALDRPDHYPVAFRQLEQRMLSAKKRVESLYAEFGDMETAIQSARQAAAEAAGYASQAARSADILTVKDNLNSEDTESALAAHQGKVLKERIHTYAVSRRYRDPMTIELEASYQKSGYSAINGFCASEDTVYLLLSNSSGQIVASFDRESGTEVTVSSALPETCQGLSWDSESGHILTSGSLGIYVLSSALRVLMRRTVSAPLCAAFLEQGSRMAWCVSGALVIGELDGTEISRFSLPQEVSSPKSLNYRDGVFYLSDSVSGMGRVTAIDEEGTVLHVWLLPKTYGTLCGVQAEAAQLEMLYLSGGAGKNYQGNYLENAFYSPIS
ncbi:MAG: hypothetical protein Q4F79_02890 [Eubacteriales bacterium]|nr:hypothetical protein [Eubacteriales bacterium]